MRIGNLCFSTSICLAAIGLVFAHGLVRAACQDQAVAPPETASPELADSADSFQSYLAHIAAANSALRLNEAVEAKRWLSQAPGDHQRWEWRYLNSRSDSSLGRIETGEWIPGRIDFSRDGKSIVVAGSDGWVRVYDVGTQVQTRAWSASDQTVYAARFSPSTEFVATCSRDGRIALWETASGTSIWTGQSGGQGLADIAFSPDGSELAFCSWYRRTQSVVGIVSTWDVESGKEKWKTDFGVKPIVAIRYSPDGSRLAVGTWDALVGVWNSSNLDSEPTVFDYKDAASYAAIDDIAFSPSGNRIAAASKSGSPRVWDLNNGQVLKGLPEHSSAVFSVAFENESRLVTGGSDGSVQIWDLDRRTCEHKYFGHNTRINSIAIAPNAGLLISGSTDKTMRFWDLNDARGFSPTERSEHIYGMTLSFDGKLLAAGGMNDTDVYVWDIATRDLKHRFKDLQGSVNYLAFGPNNLLTGGNWAGDVFVWDTAKGELVCHLKEADSGGMQQCTFSRDGKWIAVATNQKQIVIWDVEQRQVAETIKFDDGVWGIEFNPSSTLLAAGDDSGRLHAISVNDWQEAWTLSIGNSPIRDVAFTPDETKIAAGCENGQLAVVNVADHQIAWGQQAHSERIWTISVTRDGRYAVTGSADRLVKFWDLSRGCSVLTFSDATEIIYNVVCSPTTDDIFVNSAGKELFQLRADVR